MTTYVLSYTLAYNEKKTPYHWIYVYQLEDGAPKANGGVFAIRAWGKRPTQPKSMAFKSHGQANNYYAKWKDGKEIEKKAKEIARSDNPNDIIREIMISFPWINMVEHQQDFSEAMGATFDARTSTTHYKPVKHEQPIQQLPATYGWW